MDDGTQKARQRARSGQAAGVAGLLFAGLLVVALLLFRTIAIPEAGQDLTEWFAEEAATNVTIAVLYLVPFAGIAFLWFMAVLREHAGNREDRFFDTVFLGSGLLFVAMLFGGAASLATLVGGGLGAWGLTLDGHTVTTALTFGHSFFNIFAARAAGVFVMVSSSIILKTGFLPRWIGLLGIAIALILLLGIAVFNWVIYLFPAWVTLMSAALLVHLGRLPEDEA